MYEKKIQKELQKLWGGAGGGGEGELETSSPGPPAGKDKLGLLPLRRTCPRPKEARALHLSPSHPPALASFPPIGNLQTVLPLPSGLTLCTSPPCCLPRALTCRTSQPPWLSPAFSLVQESRGRRSFYSLGPLPARLP